MDDFILQFCNIEKSFFGVPVLKNVCMDIPRGHIIGMIGENGAGKSTLMNILGGVVPFDSGQILLNGENYIPHDPAAATSAGIAFIHQELNLFTNLTISENLFISNFPALGKTPFLNKSRIRSLAQEYLKMVDLDLSPDTTVDRLVTRRTPIGGSSQSAQSGCIHHPF